MTRDFWRELASALERYEHTSHTGALRVEFHHLNGTGLKAKIIEEKKLRDRTVSLIEQEFVLDEQPLTTIRSVL